MMSADRVGKYILESLLFGRKFESMKSILSDRKHVSSSPILGIFVEKN